MMITYICFCCHEFVDKPDIHKVIMRDRIFYCHKLCYWKIKYGYNTYDALQNHSA